MPSVIEQTISMCDRAFVVMEQSIPAPQLVPIPQGHVYRCIEQRLDQAILQKLVRVITSMRGILHLLHGGLYQEVGVLFRVLDELTEDVLFLCQAVRSDHLTDLHKEYLSVFYTEEFENPANPLTSPQNRPSIPRKKIHAALGAISDHPINASDAQKLYRTLSKTFSGYVHAASVHVMETYGGDPERYHVAGMRGTPRQAEYEKHSIDYFYRGFCAVTYAAVVFKQDKLVEELYRFRAYFEQHAGLTNWPDPDKAIRELRTRDA
jgi:hypothetical protein